MFGLARTAFSKMMGLGSKRLCIEAEACDSSASRNVSLGIFWAPRLNLRGLVCTFALAGLSVSALADSGSLTISPASTTLSANAGQTSFTCAATTCAISIKDAHTGSGSYTWALRAYLGTHTGPETAVALNLTTVNSIYGSPPTLSGGATPTIATSSPGTQFLTGPAGTSAATVYEVATTGLTVTVPEFTVPKTYSGTIQVTFAYDGGQSSGLINYSYTVTQHCAVVNNPTSILASSFSQSGSMTFTAPASTVSTSIGAVTFAPNTWTLQAYVSSPSGPESLVNLNMASNTQGVYSGFNLTKGTTPSIQIGGSSPGTQVASGSTSTATQPSATEIFSTGLIITVPATTAPGTYNGTLTFILTISGTSYTTTLGYSYTVPAFVSISLDQGLYFDITTPGVATQPVSSVGFNHAYSKIGATSNTAFYISASMSPLTSVSSTIPTSQLWLAMDPSLLNLMDTDVPGLVGRYSSGHATALYPATGTLAPATCTVYLSGLVMTSMANPPGNYSGTITVTITGS